MPVQESHIPQYCFHKHRNKGFVRLNGSAVYLPGRYGSAESRQEYDRLVKGWLANGRTMPEETIIPPTTPDSYTVDELCADYLEFARGYYVKHGQKTDEVACIEAVIKVWANAFPGLPVADFGPKALKRLRDEMIRIGHSRRTINNNIGRTKRMIAWAVEEEKIAGEVLHRLQAVKGLKKHRSDAKESEPIRPVSQTLVDAVLPLVGRQVAAMIQLQLATGMRPGEVIIMRGCDITEMDKAVWKYSPSHHKTEGHEIVRQIALGPKAQRIVKEFLTLDSRAFLFRPADAVADFVEAKREARKTPLYPSHVARLDAKRKEDPERVAGQYYTVDAFRRAITRGCERAFPVPAELRSDKAKAKAWSREHHWHPHQLRHSFATMIRSLYRLDDAQTLLGHQSADVTQIYAERDFGKAAEIMAKVG